MKGDGARAYTPFLGAFQRSERSTNSGRRAHLPRDVGCRLALCRAQTQLPPVLDERGLARLGGRIATRMQLSPSKPTLPGYVTGGSRSA